MSQAGLEQAIPAGEAALLDTTALISYFKGNEPASPVAAHVVDHFVVSGRNPATVSTVTAMELLVHPLRDQDDTLYRQLMVFLLHTSHLRLASIDFRTGHEAAHLRAAYGFKPPDALIMASGIVTPVRHLVTNDEAWKKKVAPPLSDQVSVCYLEDYLPFP